MQKLTFELVIEISLKENAQKWMFLEDFWWFDI